MSMRQLTIFGIALFASFPVMHKIVVHCIIGVIGEIDPISIQQYEIVRFIKTLIFPVSAFPVFNAVVTYITTFVA